MDENQALLDSLSNSQLPSLPSEPSEPVEPKEVVTEDRGKSPDEVVQSRETRLPASDKEEDHKPAKTTEKLYEVRGHKYTAKELEEAGLLEDLAVTHGKHQHLQERYNELLKSSDKPQPQPAPAAEPQLTNAMIAKTYDPVAAEITKDLVETTLIEADLPDAYPRATQTIVGQLRFLADMVFSLADKVNALVAVDAANKEKLHNQIVQNAFTEQINDLITKDAKLYGGLKDPQSRAAFVKFLNDEVHATVGQAIGENAQAFLAKQWIAFNADTMINAAKNGVEKKKAQADKRFVAGEGTGSRHGIPSSGELTHLDRMIQQSGKISE